MNKLRVRDDAGTVDARTQEGHKQFVQQDTVYGQSYNTRKFLQENTLSPHARADPSRLMSTNYNRDLEQVHNTNSLPRTAPSTTLVRTSPTATVDKDLLVSPCLYPPSNDDLYVTKHITEHTDGYSRRSTARVYDSPFKSQSTTFAHGLYDQQNDLASTTLTTSVSLPRSVKTVIGLSSPPMIARLIEPAFETRTTYQDAFKDIAYHEGPTQAVRYSNRPALSGSVATRDRPWKLRDLQDRWSRTQAQRDYHQEHPEPVPDIGNCTIRAKKEILLADRLDKRRAMAVR